MDGWANSTGVTENEVLDLLRREGLLPDEGAGLSHIIAGLGSAAQRAAPDGLAGDPLRGSDGGSYADQEAESPL